jgi:hypothetical protein
LLKNHFFLLYVHVLIYCYRQSEDTMLMMLKEIYGSMGIQTDAQLPQQTLSIERVSGSPNNVITPTETFPTDSIELITSKSTANLPTNSFAKKF